MYGRAMSCDVCGTIKMTLPDDDVYLVDGAVSGWIRMHINEPLVDNYTYKGITRSNRISSIDCCTINCAQQYLRESANDCSTASEDIK